MTHYHQPSVDEITERVCEIEELADDPKWHDRSLGWTSNDFLNEVERYMTTDDVPWDLGIDTTSPTCKAVKKILTRIRKEYAE